MTLEGFVVVFSVDLWGSKAVGEEKWRQRLQIVFFCVCKLSMVCFSDFGLENVVLDQSRTAPTI